MKKRTNWDFKDYVHTVTIYKSDYGKEVRIDEFREPGTMCGYIRFINDVFGMSVYGDFGNWIFNRQFVPSKNGAVSDDYWIGKLMHSSHQKAYRYDATETRKRLEEGIKYQLEDDGYEGDELDIMKEYYNDLFLYVDNPIEYECHSYDLLPRCGDVDHIPYEKELDYQIQIVFDAFDEMCKRLKNNVIYCLE